MKKDPEIVAFICNTWYQVKIDYIDNFLDAQDNPFAGLKWVIISVLVLALLFIPGLAFLTKYFGCLFCLL